MAKIDGQSSLIFVLITGKNQTTNHYLKKKELSIVNYGLKKGKDLNLAFIKMRKRKLIYNGVLIISEVKRLILKLQIKEIEKSSRKKRAYSSKYKKWTHPKL